MLKLHGNLDAYLKKKILNCLTRHRQTDNHLQIVSDDPMPDICHKGTAGERCAEGAGEKHQYFLGQ